MSLNCRLADRVNSYTMIHNNTTQFGRNKADFDHNSIQPCTSTIFILPLNPYGLKWERYCLSNLIYKTL